MNRIRVILLTHVIGPLDYKLPDGMQAKPGNIVIAPLGPRKMVGVVWDADVFPLDPIDPKKLRPIYEVIDVPPLTAGLRRLVDWAADYYISNHASVLRMVLASPQAIIAPGMTITEYRATGLIPQRMTGPRAAALDVLTDAQGLVRELAAQAGVSDAVIRGLIKVGAFEAVQISADAPFAPPDANFSQPLLNAHQSEAAEQMVAAVKAQKFAPFVLDGVTGSGKTETYFEAAAAALRLGKQLLILLPEIALTQPFLKRFEDRFGVAPAAWHSGMRAAERRRVWRAAADGSVAAVVGARSALFLPYKNPGLIIVD